MFNIFSKWKDRIAQYLEVRLRLLQLDVIAFTSRVLGYFIFTMLLLFLLFLLLMIMGMGLAEAFTTWTDSRTAGYFMAAGVYLVLGGLIILLRRPLLKGLAGIFIRTLTSDDDDDTPDGNAGGTSAG